MSGQDAFERILASLYERRHLMDEWAAYLAGERGQVIPLRR